jgi:hypothetical protein
MPESGEITLLILGVVLILAGMAGNKIKAFNLEIPAFASKNQRIVLFGLGILFTLAALWIILSPSLPPAQIQTSAETGPQAEGTPLATSLPARNSQESTASIGNMPASRKIGLNQTISGTLYYNEGNEWIFSEGPAEINVILDTVPYGESLIMIFDPSGVQREYVDAQGGREERLMNYSIPSGGDYMIVVRNLNNERTDYTLRVEDSGAGE